MNSKVTWGLAWAGLALVLAVPSADFLTETLAGGAPAAVLTSTTEPVQPAATDPIETASVTTRVTPRGITITPKGSTQAADPVDTYLKSGKPLPDYISDGDTTGAEAAPASPAPTSPGPAKPAAAQPTQVATVAPTPVAPTPFPASARPKPTPAQAAPAQPVVVVDEQGTFTDEASADSAGDGTWAQGFGTEPTEEESLRDYLERRGILGDGEVTSSATITVMDRSSDYEEYDPDGFYLSDGPNGEDDAAARRRARLEQLFAEDSGF